MAKYNLSDLQLTEDGDFVIENNDLALVRKQKYVIQSVRNRLKVSDPDWWDYQLSQIGANLEDIQGMPNNPDTAKLGIKLIGKSLTQDGLIDQEDLYIQPTPINKDVILFFIYVNQEYEGKPIGFEVAFNLHTGLAVRRV